MHAFLRGHEWKLFLLDFFGTAAVPSGVVPLDHVLTPYPTTPDNTFLGYVARPMPSELRAVGKKHQGVIWGKEASYFSGEAAPCVCVCVCLSHLLTHGCASVCIDPHHHHHHHQSH